MKKDLIILENLLRNAQVYNESNMVKIFEKEIKKEKQKIKKLNIIKENKND